MANVFLMKLDGSFDDVEFTGRLRAEGARRGPFRLVLEVCDHVEVTMAMARAWLMAVLDPRVPLTEFTIAARAPRAHILTQAVAVAARYNGADVPIEAFGTVERALNWRGPQPQRAG